MSLLHGARRLVRHAGLDVRRYDPVDQPAHRLVAWLHRLDVDLVVDVGANDGGFAGELRRAGWKGPMLCFEPSSEAHRRLLQRAMGDAAWHVAGRTALGSTTGTAELQLAANSTSSSLRPMLSAHVQAAPDSRILGTESVPVTTLDAWSAPPLAEAKRLFLKIDTQGFESDVLDGAALTMRRCLGIQLELSLVELYESQALWRSLNDRLGVQGFELVDIVPGFRDPASGRLLQFDGVYLRAPSPPEGRRPGALS